MRFDLSRIQLPLSNEEGLFLRELARSEAAVDLANDLANSSAGQELLLSLSGNGSALEIAADLAESGAGLDLVRDLAGALAENAAGLALAVPFTKSQRGLSLARSIARSGPGRDLATDLISSEAGSRLALQLAGSRATRSLIQQIGRDTRQLAPAVDLASTSAGRALARVFFTTEDGKAILQAVTLDLAATDAGRALARDLAVTTAALELIDGLAKGGQLDLSIALVQAEAGRQLVLDLAHSRARTGLVQVISGRPFARERIVMLAKDPSIRELIESLPEFEGGRGWPKTTLINSPGGQALVWRDDRRTSLTCGLIAGVAAGALCAAAMSLTVLGPAIVLFVGAGLSKTDEPLSDEIPSVRSATNGVKNEFALLADGLRSPGSLTDKQAKETARDLEGLISMISRKVHEGAFDEVLLWRERVENDLRWLSNELRAGGSADGQAIQRIVWRLVHALAQVVPDDEPNSAWIGSLPIETESAPVIPEQIVSQAQDIAEHADQKKLVGSTRLSPLMALAFRLQWRTGVTFGPMAEVVSMAGLAAWFNLGPTGIAVLVATLTMLRMWGGSYRDLTEGPGAASHEA